MKWISDIDKSADEKKFMIEWQDESGYRYWEAFDTEEDRQKALDDYKKEYEENRREYEIAEYEDDKAHFNRLLNYFDDEDNRCYLSNWDLRNIYNYLANGY